MKKLLKQFLEKMKKEKVPCFIFMIYDKKNKSKFIEVIVKRPYRYTEPGLMKKIPKSYRGVKVKAL